jgi:hypothetical protein
MRKTALFLAATLSAAPAFSDVHVQFLEGAPKDRFVMTNTGACDIGTAQFVIDFSASNAGLIFDVTSSGAGVEVFQPFEATAGVDLLTKQPTISDGDQRATLDITGLASNRSIAFTIDVDDTNGTREITVADNEMRGTTVSLLTQGSTYSEVISADTQVTIQTPACTL